MPLGRAEVDRLRERLEKHATQLRREMTEAIHAAAREPEANAEDDTRLAQIERDADELDRVETAIGRSFTIGYGVCMDCKQPIALERLEAEPHAERCVPCETKKERAAPVPRASL